MRMEMEIGMGWGWGWGWAADAIGDNRRLPGDPVTRDWKQTSKTGAEFAPNKMANRKQSPALDSWDNPRSASLKSHF